MYFFHNHLLLENLAFKQRKVDRSRKIWQNMRDAYIRKIENVQKREERGISSSAASLKGLRIGEYVSVYLAHDHFTSKEVILLHIIFTLIFAHLFMERMFDKSGFFFNTLFNLRCTICGCLVFYNQKTPRNRQRLDKEPDQSCKEYPKQTPLPTENVR